MANTIDTAFIKQFESEVHLAYQRMGSKLRNTVRTVGNVAGSVVRFQKIGSGSASTKSRNGMITPMELAHTTVEATMSDFYAAEYIDKLDELKTNIDERQAVATSSAAALGRKTDEILITAMDAGANSTQLHDTSSAVEKADLLSAFETMGTANIPEDGQRYIAMHPKGFADLFLITEFASSDFVGDQNLPYAGGMTMKNFLGFKGYKINELYPRRTRRATAVNWLIYWAIESNSFSIKEDKLPAFSSPSCLLYTSPSPRDGLLSRMPSSA